MSTAALKPATTSIPVQLSEMEFTAFIFPHLSMPKRGPKCKLGYHRVFNLILWVLYTPTVCLEVISLVASSCGYDSGQIAQLVAHQFAVHWATHGGPAERTQHLHPQHAQPVAHVRQRHGRRPRLTSRGCTHQTPPSNEGLSCGRTREEQRPYRCIVPRDAMPTRRSSFRLLVMASPDRVLVGSY